MEINPKTHKPSVLASFHVKMAQARVMWEKGNSIWEGPANYGWCHPWEGGPEWQRNQLSKP